MCVCLFLNLRSIGLKLIWHILFRHSKWILSQYSIHMHWRKYDLKLLNALYILYIFLNVIYFVVLHQDLCLEQIYIDVTAVLLLTGSVILLWMRDSKHKQAKLSRPLHGPGSWSEEEWMSACLIKLHTHYHMAFFSWSDVQFFCFRICLRCCLFPQVSKSHSPLFKWLGHTASVHTKGDHFSCLVWCQTTLHSLCSFSQWPSIRES